MSGDLGYQSGFGNEFATEALPGALPRGRNNPQKAPYDLYAEQLSGSAFTALPAENQRSWLYRILPSAVHSPYRQIKQGNLRSTPFDELPPPPNQLRWDPLPWPEQDVDFVEGFITFAGNGSVATKQGSAVHLYLATKSMDHKCFYNADGDLLIVPQEGRLLIRTELGVLDVAPGEIAVIQRGIKFQVCLADGNKARGYVCENFGEHFVLPYRGALGANGLANPRDFLTPVAAFEDVDEPFEMVAKFQGGLWTSNLRRSPFDVVAWHGNYAPYKYDLSLFNTINTVSFDHPDPSIFTVLTSPSGHPGIANVDFVIFPPRWMVAEDTFRPPYFHRNVMSEYMGLIYGTYDAKPSDKGFVPGGGSLHNCMTAHGPDAEAFAGASQGELKPIYMAETLAFMFESSWVYRPTRFAMESKALQKDYLKCWQGLEARFGEKSP